MDLLSKKHRKFPIYLAIPIGVLLYIISTTLYYLSNNYIVTGSMTTPYKPPFDNIWLRILAREAMIWFMFSMNVVALRITQLKQFQTLLLVITVIADIVTLATALFRIKFDSQFMYEIYSNVLWFLLSAMPYTIIVLLSLLQSNIDKGQQQNA